jgi:hypothetical protein
MVASYAGAATASTLAIQPNAWILEELERHHPRKRLTAQSLDELARTRSEVLTTLKTKWADKTWAGKRTVWSQWTQYRALHPMVDLGTQMCLFLQGLTVGETSRFRYGKDLRQMLRATGEDVPILLIQYLDGLRIVAKAQEEKQALPLFGDLFYMEWAKLPQSPLRTALWLARKTDSRIDDPTRLRKGSFLAHNPTELIIWFGFRGANKSARQGIPFREHLFVHVLEELHLDMLTTVSSMVETILCATRFH